MADDALCRVALSRVRGLKPYMTTIAAARASRTLTSAWIETMQGWKIDAADDSRTLTSAWIETVDRVTTGEPGTVALSRVRGLKQQTLRQQGKDYVALSRVRGLKLITGRSRRPTTPSHSHECVD